MGFSSNYVLIFRHLSTLARRLTSSWYSDARCLWLLRLLKQQVFAMLFLIVNTKIKLLNYLHFLLDQLLKKCILMFMNVTLEFFFLYFGFRILVNWLIFIVLSFFYLLKGCFFSSKMTFHLHFKYFPNLLFESFPEIDNGWLKFITFYNFLGLLSCLPFFEIRINCYHHLLKKICLLYYLSTFLSLKYSREAVTSIKFFLLHP